MKKKQKDDVMGEEESDLPVVDGELQNMSMTTGRMLIYKLQYLVAAQVVS